VYGRGDRGEGVARRGRGSRQRTTIVAITMSVTEREGEEEDGYSFNSGQNK
jgi:hypothetical protein